MYDTWKQKDLLLYVVYTHAQIWTYHWQLLPLPDTSVTRSWITKCGNGNSRITKKGPFES